MLMLPAALLVCLAAVALGAGFEPRDVNLPKENALLAAFGDVNSDLSTDLFFISRGANGSWEVRVQVWDKGAESFYFPPSPDAATTDGLVIRERQRIDAVVPGDFNWDGKMDVLVMGPSLSGSTANATRLHLYLGHYNRFDKEPIVLPDAIGQPLVLDANGDFRLDLFGTAAASGKRSFWLNRQEAARDGRGSTVNFTVVEQSLAEGGMPLLASPHSNAVVDMDGDCAGDLLVTSQHPSTGERFLELWMHKKATVRGDPHYSFLRSFLLPNGTGQLTYADYDGDGNIDILFPVCWPAGTCEEDNSIHIIYNQQFSSRSDDALCTSLPFTLDPFALSSAPSAASSPPSATTSSSPSSSSSSASRPSPRPSSVASSSPSSQHQQQGRKVISALPSLDPAGGNGKGTAGHVIVGREAFGPGLALLDGTGGGGGGKVPPLTLRTGDANLDGYPDLLVPLRRTKDSKEGKAGETMITLWLNVPCDSASCHPTAAGAGRRTFVRSTDGTEALEGLKGAVAAAFFDISDEGSIDALVIRYPSPDAEMPTVTAVSNAFEEDAYFLTTLISNGVCNAWCPSGDRFPSPKPYGVNQPGAVVKFTVTDVGGAKLQRTGVQLPQSAWLSLSLPYSLHGLGRTNNYIEHFYVGLATDQDKHYNSWVAQIPNSQLVCFPWPRHNPLEWTLELLISPSTRLLKVVLSLAATLVGLAGAILFLHWKERKQDEAESRQTSHLFVF